MKITKKIFECGRLGLGIFALLLANLAFANPLSNVNVVDIPQGYELEIHHKQPLKYVSHSPKKDGNELTIQLAKTNAFDAEQDEAFLNWGKAFGVPVTDIAMFRLQQNDPVLRLNFSKGVKFSVSNTRDNRMTIVRIETDRPKFTGPVPVRDTGGADNLITALIALDPDQTSLLERANKAMLDQDYRRAVQVLTRVRELGNEQVQAPVQELIGLTREYLGQNAQAKAEYEEYLEKFPEGEAASRIQQRLNALITAATLPKEKRKEAKDAGKDPSTWRTNFYGGLAQHYYYDEFNSPSQEKRTLRSALNNNLNLAARASNDTYDVRARFAGTYQKDFEFDGEQDVVNPHTFSVEARQKDWGLFGRLGRQTRTSGGVLGRFDGGHVAYELNPKITLNGVFGFPVDYLNKDSFNVDQQFVGASVDVGDLWEGWEFSAFVIGQDYMDVVDRRAIGGEARYFDSQKHFFSLIDYDVEFDHLNIFMTNGRYEFNKKTAVTAGYHFRSNPILISTAAMMGQRRDYFEDITYDYTKDEIMQLVAARVSDYTTANLGISHKLNKQWTLDGELMLSDYSGTKASTGIDIDIAAIAGTGVEMYYTARATSERLFFEDDRTIFQMRYSDTDRAQTVSFLMNWRLNVTDELRLNPKLRFDNRSYEDGDSRVYTRYNVNVDYKLRKALTLEFDLGYDWQEDETEFITFETTGLYMTAGYRWRF